MSEVLWVRLEGRANEPDSIDHSLMFEFTEPLDALAAKLGVTPLSAFYDWTDYEANAEPQDEDESRVVALARWHEAPALLCSLRMLAEALGRHPEAIGADESTTAVLMEELDDCITKVQEAVDQRRRVHLCVAM
jgi:hypothetical protein